MVGYAAYADRFAGTLAGVGERASYLRDLGVGYLHLMPLLTPRPAPNDGGYAVMDYRSVRPDLGTVDDLRDLATTLRGEGISLCLDLVLNHVAREHEWAAAARAGDAEKRAYFHVYDDRAVPDAYEATLPEVFPDFAPGSFTWDDELAGWVWTTFNDYQWDVDWSNPAVLCEYADLILGLANLGVEVFRLDAIAFIWKRLGTDCQNQPEVHELTRALRTVARIAAPAVLFKAEAIVGPADLPGYLGVGRHARPGERPRLPQRADGPGLVDAGLGRRGAGGARAAAGAAAAVDHGVGRPTSAATTTSAGPSPTRTREPSASTPPRTAGSCPTGTPAPSRARGRAGWSSSRTRRPVTGGSPGRWPRWPGSRRATRSATARILLAHAVVLAFGGLPVIWMGDELGLLNDAGWADDPAHAADNRWVHRPRMPWRRWRRASDPHGITAGLRHLLDVRRSLPHLHAATPTEVWDPRDPRRPAGRPATPRRAAAGRPQHDGGARRGSTPTCCTGSGSTPTASTTRSAGPPPRWSRVRSRWSPTPPCGSTAAP